MNRKKPELGPILGATIMAPNLDETIKPYIADLSYQIVNQSIISRELATAWNTSAHVGARTTILKPESGSLPWIRFVEASPLENYRAMTTYGWHSLELTVQNVDEIPSKLIDSAFKIIGEPHNLGMSSSIRAMQVIGRAEEVLYLTQIPDDGSTPHLPNAKSFIDHIFIVPLGSPNMDETRSWYMDQFPNIKKGMEARDIKISLITNALGINPDTKVSICTIRLPNKSSIEIDDYPAEAKERPRHANSLPPGIAIVSFGVDSLEKVTAPFLAPPRPILEAPYNGQNVGVIQGNASEIIELVEG